MDCRVNRGYLRADRKNTVFISAEVGGAKAPREAGPLDICLAIDCSRSMWGKKLKMAKEAAAGVVDKLRPTDYISLVRFATKAKVVMPRRRVESREEIKRRIGKMGLGLGTALYDGIRLAYGELAEATGRGEVHASRIVILTDGEPTEGPKDERSFASLCRDIRSRGISMTAVGIGKDYKEDLLIGIARVSDGRWCHVRNPDELPRVFEDVLNDMKSVEVVRPTLQAQLMTGAELTNVYRVGEMVTEITDYQREDGKYVIPLEDVRAGSASKIVFKIHIPPNPEGKLRIAKLAVSAPGTELTKDIAVESTQDQSRWGVETDPYPRALLTLAEATVVARQAVSDPTQVGRAQELMETVMRDPAAATEVRKDPSLMGIGSTVLRVTETVAKGRLTEDDKKRLKQDTTVIRK